MGIPKLPPSGHLSATPPHQHALPLFAYLFTLFFLSSTTPLHLLTRFSRFSYTCALSTGSVFRLPFWFLSSYTIFGFTRNKHSHQASACSSQPCLIAGHHNPKDHVQIFLFILIMDNFFTPIPTTTRAPSTSSPFSTSLVYYFPPHEGHLQFPHAFPLEQVGQHLAYPAYPFVIGAGQQPHDLLSKEQERRLVDAWTTKIARSKRKMARQRSLSSSKNPASWATSNQVYTRGLAVYGADDAEAQNSNIKRDTYTFFTPDKKVGFCEL